MRVKQLIEDDLNKRSAKHANKSTLVARGADTQLEPSCVSAPLATNVDLWKPLYDNTCTYIVGSRTGDKRLGERNGQSAWIMSYRQQCSQHILSISRNDKRNCGCLKCITFVIDRYSVTSLWKNTTRWYVWKSSYAVYIVLT